MYLKQTGRDFLENLRSGAVRPTLTRTGMAKLGDPDSDSIMFSESDDCGNWTKIPLELVQSVEVIGWLGCKDHKHPIIRLELHEPKSENKLAVVLFELLTAKDSVTAVPPTMHSPEDDLSRKALAPPRTNGGGSRGCLQNCVRDCRSGRPFLTGSALGQCLRECRRECGYA